MERTYLLPNWPAPANIHAAMTLRFGGVSSGAYTSLNPATHVGDDIANVQANRYRLKAMLDLPSEPVWLNQIHSSKVVKADKPETLAADASFTEQAGVVCAVMTADCLPLLICSTDGKKIAAIHAGWKGLLNGIITNTVKALQTLDLLVWLGAAIGAECFEVGAEVRAGFIQKNQANAAAFSPKADKWLADIYQLARIELAGLGINEIYGGGLCTVCERERFYSYRRDLTTGRMATLIWKDAAL